MKRINKIIAVIMSITVMITATSAVTVDAYAASKPSATSITSVSAKSSSITVKWKKKSCTGYQVQYSTSSKFKSAKTVKIAKAKTVSKTISKLKSSKKYYVRVRTYKKSGKKTKYSSWSKAKSVTTKKASLGNKMNIKATLNNPKTTNPDDYVLNKVKLSWDKVKDAEYYVIYFKVPEIYKKTREPNECCFDVIDSQADFTYANGITENCFKYDYNYSITCKSNSRSLKISNRESLDYIDIKIEAYKTYYDKKWKMDCEKLITSSEYQVKLTKCEDSAKLMLDEAYAQMNINAGMSDFDKIVQIQKWIDANWHYTKQGDPSHNDTGCSCGFEYGHSSDYVGTLAHWIVLTKHGGCNCFAYAFRYFANKAGVPCEVIHGASKDDGTPHYWNWVCVDGYWYDYDCENYGVAGDPFAYCDSKWAIMRAFDNYQGGYNLSEDSQQIVNFSNPKADDNMIRQRNKTINQVLYNRGL